MYDTVMNMKDSVEFIYKEQKELSVFGGIAALLGWDQMTYMPTSGASDRAEQSALISRLSHEKVVSDTFWNHIQILSKNIDQLDEKDQHVVTRLEKDIEKSRKIPSDFVTRSVKTTTMAYQKWEEARKQNNFTIFSPHLKEIVSLEKEYCGYINLPGPRYNSLLDGYEEGMTVDLLKREFAILKQDIVHIFQKIQDSDRYQKQEKPILKMDAASQKNLTQLIMKQMQLPNEKSRIDESTHPFTTSLGYNDVRITTSYARENPLFSFFSTIHEAGHALYELGMPQDNYKDTVISDSPSLGIHESQSRFWENMIGRSKAFWQYFYPEFTKHAPQNFHNISFDDWYFTVNMVKPSFIRVEADELTYCLHVILRFEIETDLMEEKINVDDLPTIWNEKMHDMLGITPSNDVEGVLQDMHWSGGSIGYFPTYAIGSIYAAQLFQQLVKDQPDTIHHISQGKFTEIISWLRTNIHNQGRLYCADDIIKKVCGEGMNSKIYTSYLQNKYFNLYDI
jgi:carboxypeptidase Taq